MTILYSNRLAEAKAAPQVELDGKVYTGRLLSHEEFLRYEEAVYLTMQETQSLASEHKALAIAREFLSDVFIDYLTNAPREPYALTRWERLQRFFTGKRPARWLAS